MNDTQPPPEKKEKAARLPAWVIFVAIVALLGFLIFLALGLVKSQNSTLTLGSEVPDFNVTTFDGKTASLSSFRGKTVVINFWASWCTTCMDEAAILQAGWNQVEPAGQVVFIGIDYADTEPAAKAYLQKYSISYLNGPDLQSKVSQLFHITGVPETYLVDADGILRGVKIGPFSSSDELTAFLDQKTGK